MTSAALSDTAWVETATTTEIIADFGNLKQCITKSKGKTDTQTHFKVSYFQKILQAKSSPLYINRRISVVGLVWRIWAVLQAVIALTIAGEQG